MNWLYRQLYKLLLFLERIIPEESYDPTLTDDWQPGHCRKQIGINNKWVIRCEMADINHINHSGRDFKEEIEVSWRYLSSD